MKKGLVLVVIFMFFLSTMGFARVEKKEVIISAAASLKEVMEELKEKFESNNKNIKIGLNFGGSGALKNQILAGAPVDLVFFASQKDLKDLDERGFIDENYKSDILKNKLVVAGRLEIDSMKKLLNNTVAIGIPETVPAGKYSKEAFINSGLWDKIQNNLVYAKDVRSAAQYVDLYEVDYAVIYKTDAKVLKNSEIVYVIPENLYTPITYSYGIIKDKKTEDTIKFYEFLKSSIARKVYEKYGFQMVN